MSVTTASGPGAVGAAPGLDDSIGGADAMAKASPIDRFLAKVEWSEQRYEGTRCLVWTGHTIRGYGGFHAGEGSRTVRAHRWAHERWIGPIPDGYEVDHLCDNPSCVNPAHLKAVTPEENWRRSSAPSALNARKTHCAHGHEFTEENTHIRPCGARACRICMKDVQARYVVRRREQNKAAKADPDA